MKEILIGLAALVIAAGVAYGVWLFKRNFNYAFEYEAKVIETVEAKYEKRITTLEKQVALLQREQK